MLQISQFYVVDRASGALQAQLDAELNDLNDLSLPTPKDKPGHRRSHSKSAESILVGRHQLRVKAVHPKTKRESWRAQLSYFPT